MESRNAKINRSEVVRDAVASVIDDLDMRPDEKAIMLMRHTAQRVAIAYEHEMLNDLMAKPSEPHG